MQTVVGGVTSQSAVHALVERASRQVPVLLNPCRPPTARRLKLLTCGAPLDTWHALAIWHPVPCEFQQREAPLHARMQTTAAQEGGLVGGDLKVALRQPLGEHPIQPLRILLRAEGTDPVLGIAAQPCLAATVRLDHRLEPHVQRVMRLDIREDGGEYTSYKVANMVLDVHFANPMPVAHAANTMLYATEPPAKLAGELRYAVLEFSTKIPRAQLRPGYGDGFLGAPLQAGRFSEQPPAQPRGGRRGTSSTLTSPAAGDSHHV